MPEQLRAEVRRLHQTMRTTLDPVAKRKFAQQALELAQEAEAVASLPNDISDLHLTIAHYRHMLAGAENETRRRLIGEVLQRADDKLQQITRNTR
jgi:hypothetical protein